jgi:hypothetical protein
MGFVTASWTRVCWNAPEATSLRPNLWSHSGGRRPENIVIIRRPPQGLSFWLGVILMALSFGIYPAYPVVPFLPISAWRMGEVAVGLSAVSWGLFFVGSVLVGKKGVAYLKRRFFDEREHQHGRDRT